MNTITKASPKERWSFCYYTMVFVCIKSAGEAKLALEFLVQNMYNIYILFMIIGINVYKFQKGE